jgi:FMN-dependent oxidoreductase (nitrilotriacetate monooxygenase family)
VHAIEHVGRHYQVEGALTAPRSAQGRPVYVQAGSSNEGRAFAARNAEAIFTAHQTIEDAQAFYADIKSRAARLGRNPDHVKVLPGISPFLGDTEAEARELQEYVNSLTVPAYGRAQLATLAGVSLDDLDLDEKVPASLFGGAGDVLDNNRSRLQVVANIVQRDQPTLRQLLHRLAGARGHNVVAGTPTQVADIITAWFQGGAADGFNVMPPLYPQLLDAFTDQVVPILQDRGLFRTEYVGGTLREHYGLPRPASIYAEGTATGATA